MSRFSDEYEAPDYPNAGDLWAANARRALSGKRGRKALAELREALLALPEKRLISGALCTVNASERIPDEGWYKDDLEDNIKEQGEGVCAIGAYLWFKKVKSGADPQAAFAELPTLYGEEEGSWETASAGQRAGLTYTLAWDLAYRNDELLDAATPEERYASFLAWIEGELAADRVAA